MFTTGFTMNAANFAESMNGKTIKWMESLAFEKKCALAGSIIIKENNSFLIALCLYILIKNSIL